MKIKTKDLIGPALDWAVARCNGYNEWEWDRDVSNCWLICRSTQSEHWLKGYYEPSTDWAQGGPIVEREQISVQVFDRSFKPNVMWNAYMPGEMPMIIDEEINGPTPLIAAMRCFVASKLGDEVDIPEELT